MSPDLLVKEIFKSFSFRLVMMHYLTSYENLAICMYVHMDGQVNICVGLFSSNIFLLLKKRHLLRRGKFKVNFHSFSFFKNNYGSATDGALTTAHYRFNRTPVQSSLS